MTALRLPVALLVVLTLLPLAAPVQADPLDGVQFQPFDLPESCRLAAGWMEKLVAERPGEWVTMELQPTDEQLAALGLPPAALLAGMRFPQPTMLTAAGERISVPLEAISPASHGPVPATYAGTGCFGIRPGAFILIESGGAITLCSLAHVYGAPGSYSISTAGHCTEKVGERISVIAAVGNHGGILSPVLLDFGQTSKTTGDGGVGNDWALISVYSEFQSLVTPTMCFWGGPRGVFTPTGAVADANVLARRGIVVDVDPVNPDPTLVSGLVHYGHGLGQGTGGTPRAGAAFIWDTRAVRFEGSITPGDSGSGANAADGRAAAIITHILVPAAYGNGAAVAAGTRVTLVGSNLADGQIVPYPVPLPGAP